MTELLGGSLILLLMAVVLLVAGSAVLARMRLSGNGRTSGSLGNALSHVQSLIEPSRKNAIEVKQVDERSRDDRSGDPPKP